MPLISPLEAPSVGMTTLCDKLHVFLFKEWQRILEKSEQIKYLVNLLLRRAKLGTVDYHCTLELKGFCSLLWDGDDTIIAKQTTRRVEMAILLRTSPSFND